MILLGTEQMKLRVAQSRLEQSCNLGWEDKSNWWLRSLELAAFSSALVLPLQLFQASVVAFAMDMNWKTPVLWNCCSSPTSFFLALVFPEVEDHSSLHVFWGFFLPVAGKDAQHGKRKQSCFFCRVLVEESLKVHSHWTGDTECVRGVCDQGGEFQEWSRLSKDGQRFLCLCSVWGDANRTQSPWREKDPPFHSWGGYRTGSLIPLWVSSKYLPALFWETTF